MIKSFLKYIFQLLFIAGAILISAYKPFKKQINAIVFADERIQITPKEFYIANVTDERVDKGPVASIMSSGPAAVPYQVDFKGGAVSAIKEFINNNLQKNTAFRPVIIGLKKIGVKETQASGNRVEGHISLMFSFYIDKGGDEKIHLADYNGSAVYDRDATQTKDIEPTLRRVLVNGLLYINTWMDQQAGTNIKLARGVKVRFIDYDEKPEGDSIYYNIKRPLTWADFQSKVPASRYAAEVFPTLGYDERVDIVKGIINLRLAVKTCLPKSASWVKEGSRTDYTLNHEQRHFDIVKIAAEHFKQGIKAGDLPVDNYEGPINMEYLDAYREMNNLQKQYDTETSHGMDTAEQERWNERIDKELKALGVR